MFQIGLRNDLATLALGKAGKAYPPLRSKSVVIGDSLTDGTYRSFYSQLVARTRGRYKNLNNASAPGRRTDNMLSVISTDVLPYNPEVAFFLGGSNDRKQNVADATIRANIAAIADQLQGAGIACVFPSLPPNSDFPSWIPQHNAWLQQFCAGRAIRFVDICTPLSDGNGDWNPAYKFDAMHWNAAGAALAATTIANAFSNSWTPWPLATTDTASASNLVANAISMVDSNSDGVPDGFAILGAGVTCSAIDDPQRGKALRMTISGGSGSGIQFATSANWSVGETLLPLFDLDISAGFTNFSMGFRFNGPNTNTLVLSPWAADGTGIFHGKAVIPASTTSVSYRIYVTGSGTVDLYKPTCRNLTRAPFDY